MDHIIATLEIKSIDEKGSFVGYGAAYGNVDDGNDVIEHGAFDETIAEHTKAGTMPGMFWMHKKDEPIGEWSNMYSDQNGLIMEGQLWVGKGIGKAEQAHMLLKSKGPKGLSIGYGVKEGGSKRGEKNGKSVRFLKNLGLGECSPVTFPMNRKATIISVKSDFGFSFKNSVGELKTIREIEQLLRDGGLSDTEAKKFLAGGYPSMAPRDKGLSDLLALVKKHTPNA